MPTTVQLDEKTKETLLKYASDLQMKLGRKITFDEAIRFLVQEVRGTSEAREKFDSLFGSLAGRNDLWRELEETRKRERIAVERKARAS
jgi:hypothetical protein